MFFSGRERKNGFFSDFDRFNRMIDEMFENAFKEIKEMKSGNVQGEFKQYGPYVYGFSMNVGPDGKPVIKEFGNVKPSLKEGPSIREVRDPLIDVFEEKDSIRVLAEMPGVNKEDIEITLDGLTLVLKTEKGQKFFKELKLPSKVKTDDVHATYKNGVLELNLKKEKEKKGTKIKIE